MAIRSIRNSKGFSVLDLVMTVGAAGIVLAFAIPKIASAVQEFRLRSATNLLADLMARAKMQAVAENTLCSVVVDSANYRLGIISYNAGVAVNTSWVSMPWGITFGLPGSVTAPMTGAPTASTISFPVQTGKTTVFQQDFLSTGFPNVAAGAVNAIYFTNGKHYGAVTLTCVGSIQLWQWDGSTWRSGHY